MVEATIGLHICFFIAIVGVWSYIGTWLVSASFGAMWQVVGTLLAWWRTRRRPKVMLEPSDFHISVLKPMCGVDPRADENLETFAALDVPTEFRVFLCLARESDPAYPIAARFVKKYPKRFTLVVGLDAGCINPKISQMVNAWPLSAKNPFMWISESNVETSQAFMENLVGTLKEAKARKDVPTPGHFSGYMPTYFHPYPRVANPLSTNCNQNGSSAGSTTRSSLEPARQVEGGPSNYKRKHNADE